MMMKNHLNDINSNAMMAIERAADLQTIENEKIGFMKILIKRIAVEKLYCDVHRTPNDTALKLNNLEPRLGDRVVNLTSDGVPFGLRGTVITIHSNTNYVEVLFDSEFIGGKGLNGSCSQFRGKLCPWSSLLLISRPNEYKQYLQRSHGKSSSVRALQAALVRFDDGHVKGQFPAPKQSNSSNGAGAGRNNVQRGHVTEITRNIQQKSVGPTVSLASKFSPDLAQPNLSVALKNALQISAPSKLPQQQQELQQQQEQQSEMKQDGKKESVLTLLKKHLNIPIVHYTDDVEDGDDAAIGESLTKDDSSIPKKIISNGTGQQVLAAAAATVSSTTSDIAIGPMEGVISCSSIASSDVILKLKQHLSSHFQNPTPPAVNTIPRDEKKISLNKEASYRIIKHELQPNKALNNDTANKARSFPIHRNIHDDQFEVERKHSKEESRSSPREKEDAKLPSQALPANLNEQRKREKKLIPSAVHIMKKAPAQMKKKDPADPNQLLQTYALSPAMTSIETMQLSADRPSLPTNDEERKETRTANIVKILSRAKKMHDGPVSGGTTPISPPIGEPIAADSNAKRNAAVPTVLPGKVEPDDEASDRRSDATNDKMKVQNSFLASKLRIGKVPGSAVKDCKELALEDEMARTRIQDSELQAPTSSKTSPSAMLNVLLKRNNPVSGAEHASLNSLGEEKEKNRKNSKSGKSDPQFKALECAEELTPGTVKILKR